MYSVDFEEIEQYQRTGKWEEATAMLTDLAVKLEGAGADFLVICTNMMHKMANEVQAAASIPLLHIAEATADRIASQGITKIGLLGTKYTMEQDFYKGRLLNRGMEVLVPQEKDRQAVNHIIYDELCKGTILPASKEKYKEIIGRLVAEGAEGIILGCTEITLLIKEGDSPVPCLIQHTFMRRRQWSWLYVHHNPFFMIATYAPTQKATCCKVAFSSS